MIKHLWEVEYTIISSLSFQVITEEKNLCQVEKAVNTFFEGKERSIEDVKNIEYQGIVYE